MGRVLSIVALMSQAARLLQQHHQRAVSPCLQGGLSVTAATGLASALDRLQGLALGALRSTLEAFFAQVSLAGAGLSVLGRNGTSAENALASPLL